ncbi:DUF5020 family protein [Geopsychrobacter electrodiphilus]|uniref:DUF5020 family protein n=1 Tax=Geopsychrobacter electrodiphilus TaxID=225196 RepID=UPI00035EB38B|nr:DUF5020 family protein [Geopsychrobacter electrodiphilus]
MNYTFFHKSLSLFTTVLMLTTLLMVCGTTSAFAGSAQWQTSNVELLLGSGYKLGDDTRTTLTFEHANGWKYGDNFFFLDVVNPMRDGVHSTNDLYAEFSPRLSLSKISGKKIAFGFVKDVLLASTLEMGEYSHNYLYGVGFSLDLPKFAYADINIYVRNNPNQDGQTYQITPVWALPFTVGSAKMLFEGFADIAGSEGNTKFNIDCQPRLLLDVGNFWQAPDSLWVGVEYMYWHNKFGVDGANESLPQAMVKWVF